MSNKALRARFFSKGRAFGGADHLFGISVDLYLVPCYDAPALDDALALIPVLIAGELGLLDGNGVERGEMIRVLVVDDHKLVRQGLCVLLMKAQDIKTVGEARDGQEAIDLAQHLQPDVILMDIEMPRMDGLRATCQLTASGSACKVLILSMRLDEEAARQAAACGARGYLVKDTGRQELIAAIRAVFEGKRVASPGVGAFFCN
jgi:CheY-like chemotaxis protein